MTMTADELARRIDGTLEGDKTVAITHVASLDEAESGTLTFLSSSKYAKQVAATRASAILVARDWQGPCPCPAVIRVDSPDQALAVAAPLLAPPPPELAPGVHPSAVVADDVELGEGVRIGPHVVIERGAKIGAGSALWAGCYIGVEAVVGENCVLYPLSSLRERVRLGDRVIIHNGAVIGSDGFGYLPEKDGSWTKILQVGIVEIGDDSEIGANVTVDRARFGKTVIGKGVKIDNLVQVAHNVQIGDHTAMAAQVGISGTTKIGKHVRMGGQVGLAGHLSVGDGAILGAQSGISKDVKPGAFMFGSPAAPIDKTMKAQASLLRLPKLKKRMAELERRLAALEAQGEEAKH